ncbi:MAG: multicopper oxidase domain-containing protein [Rhizomicrobium sp.]|nr:multicopper oxidase domain-containing protein [Rhizomicrobium sp.]
MHRSSLFRTFLVVMAVAVMALLVTAPSMAAPANPCAVPVDVNRYGMKPFQNPPVISSVGGVLTATLDIRYTNPATTMIGECHLKLRSYGGTLVGPTLRVKPGDVMKIVVKNSLPPVPCKPEESMAMGHMAMSSDVYNWTNLHTHGLHLSPGDNPNGTHSDNVFINICPGTSARYEIHIPKDQPPGTSWYHAHLHGSTALQVSSSMEGAIIVEGGLDNVPQIKAAKDQIFALQQISYDSKGEIENAADMYDNWEQTGSRTMVNGQLVPKIEMRPGEVQRWRFIDGGVSESLYLQVAGMALNEIATDGNALGRIDVWRTPLELEPGYRSDVLFKAPLRPGRYYLTSGAVSVKLSLLHLAAPGEAAVVHKATPATTVAVIDVTGPVNDMPLPTSAELAPYQPFKPITNAELNGAPQKMSFALEEADCSGPGPCKPCPPGQECDYQYMVDMYSYPKGPTRFLKLNTASEWTLEVASTSAGQAHPFHIHVNPFQMVRKGPTGADETVWKDTLMVREGAPLKYRVVRSRYVDFTGAFVLHCHILPHEDSGMMQKVEIVK